MKTEKSIEKHANIEWEVQLNFYYYFEFSSLK